jgi:hypothetical protein
MNDIEKGQFAQDTVQCFTRVDGSLARFPSMLKRVIRERMWERRSHNGHVFELKNLRELITEMPIRGWGQDPAKIEAVIKDDAEALEMFREAMKRDDHDRGNQHTGGKGNNVIGGTSKQGNSRAYSIARVRREAPEFIDDVLAGKISPHAALVKAGIRKTRTVYLPKDPKVAAKKLRELFGEKFLIQVCGCLRQLT